MYDKTCTRPDVSYALSMVSQYQDNPGEAHWTLVNNILNYLWRIKEIILVFGSKNKLKMSGYIDGNFQIDRDNFCSQSG